jgi:hypothetical protein
MWFIEASMSTARYIHTATMMSNGNILVTGGRDRAGDVFTSVEIFNVSANIWTSG